VSFVLKPGLRLDADCRKWKSDSDVLQYKLQDLPEEGGFVKLQRDMELLGLKFGGNEDAVKKCPHEKDLEKVLSNLENTFSRTDFIKALKPIQDENYSSYVHPTDEELAAGARAVLEKHLSELVPDGAIKLERANFKPLEKEQNDYFESFVDMETADQVLPDRRLLLVDSRNGGRMIVTSSYFLAFAENVDLDVRFQSIQDYCTLLNLLVEAGNVSRLELERQQAILCSFLMRLEGLEHAVE
jgi:hypothetical protein